MRPYRTVPILSSPFRTVMLCFIQGCLSVITVYYTNVYETAKLDSLMHKNAFAKERYLMGLGKRRSKFGEWLDERGVKQSWVAEQSGVSMSAISALASGRSSAPSLQNARAIIKALHKFDTEVSAEDFWGH
jgi:predicted XRE-type DNA-binding protein